MASLKMFLVYFSSVAHQLAFFVNGYCTKSLVPALYVFGDSSVDAGNNNNLNTPAKANIFPYGLDLNNCSTGRFSNGKIFADIIALKLGLPMPPPYMGLSENDRYHVTTGINYASGSCGILNKTRVGGCLSLDKQIEYFTSTVKKDLPEQFRSQKKLKHYLSKSIYLFNIGSNDYVLNYFKDSMGTHKRYNPEEFADYLLWQFACRIQKIYDLGARKFVIIGIGPMGCVPGNLIQRPHSQDCNEDMNQKVKAFSYKLPGKLHELQSQLTGSLFITLDSFNFFETIRTNPQKFGFRNITGACAVKGEKPCENRNEYYFFDFAHTTEAANKVFADECFSGNKVCFPFNIEKLAQAH